MIARGNTLNDGTTAAGKSTVGTYKFMLKVAESNLMYHLIAAENIGIAEKNLVNAERGIISEWSLLAEYFPNGKDKIRLPHIRFETPNGIKIIYIAGYGDVAKWKKVLGSQFGCVYIDEVNICSIEFLREVTHRCKYMMTTSNPDAPDLPIYKEFINRSRPLKKYEKDYPRELLNELSEPCVDGWVHWYFTFNDNASLSKQDIKEKVDAVPVGTKMYKNKILGLRGRATGLVFNLKSENIITEEEAKKLKYLYYTIGCDTSYSKESHDKLSFAFVGITRERKCVVLATSSRNNKDAVVPFAPSDVIPLLIEFAEACKVKYGFSKNVYIDSADAGTIQEAQKYKRNTACIYDFAGAWKKTKIITRIQLQQSWMHTGDFLVVNTCTDYIDECNTYSYTEEGLPEDGHDHVINACQYAWLPYKSKIGDMDAIKQIIKDADD